MPTVVSLFSGCGGSDAGVLRAGFDVLMANDILPYARDVYLANHPETDYVLGDVSAIESFPSADMLVGCYPCQGFSQGGVRKADRKINTLYLEFARALRIVKPKAFIVENVSGMVRKNFEHLLKDQFKVFEEAGYRVKSQILNASHFGVAQDRKRIFIVGIHETFGVDFSFPTATHGEGLKKVNTIRDAIGDLPEWPVGEFYDADFHWYYLSRNRRQDWDQISKTIVANPRHMPLHPISPTLEKLGPDKWQFTSNDRARRFSFREAAYLQGFGNLVFPETERASMNMKYTVVGNAVPPPLFEAVARGIPDIW
ncbi:MULTISPECIES: DNA cytosine methyltransferase [Enterobacteriaceae]|jgi:DNA (cytosine-5)-methyltransferase 1|uniref:Cytosine-specific methyltransferase n=2 Tax=Enterobacteriaceae TaxID=543 RepID=A0A483GW09_KLEPN|nr:MULTISPECIES: DNA (cytosine-5-)-methyltransferase [Enterobacteriaceae]MDU1915134.1 DNA (cytosine-5-)-methyltransferase [Clostridium perfringens]DAI77965.1 MAG TPA: Cytosine specific methyltransferase [Caudoviricetes sp.]HBR1077608.1 DNA (cytosine-5-)-methyltransferase [Klebsiella quasipneumoniae subsp. quasipneumoniae]HDH1294691.1 DNA (cytosine-5-)-methyltransferase [Klebsiella quasipneumoniae subsp. similipneumoniae]HDS2595536.1 DNA (cytosine-5-)-methyltransferase [Klebsiella pneumoniae su